MLAKSALPFGDSREGLSLAYSPNLVEEEFCELRLLGILRSSWARSSRKFTPRLTKNCNHLACFVITTMVMIKLNAPRTLLTSSQLKGRDTPAKDTPALAGSYSPANPSLSCSSRTFAK